MADGYISQIKTLDNKTYLLRDSEKTDEKVSQASNSENKEFPIILKNTNNTTDETAGVKYAGGVTVNPDDKTITADEFIGNLKVNKLIPINEITYPAYTCSADNEAKAVLFFGKVTINDTTIWQAPWTVRYRVYASTTEANTQGWYDCNFTVSGSTVNYYIDNNFYSGSYRPIYNHRLVYPKNGYSSYGAYFGVRIQSSRTPTSLARVLKIELLEATNCTVELFPSIKRFDEIYVTTNNIAAGTIWYNTDYNGTDAGLRVSGNANTNDTGYYILTNGFRMTAGTNKVSRYTLFGRIYDGTYESFTITSNSTATTKEKNPHGFLPDGKIYWNSAGGEYTGAVALSVYEQYHSIDYRYTFNITTTGIPANVPTYVKWTYTDGLLYLADEWFATELPTTEDNFIYQRIGSNYYGSADYRGSLLLNNPYYIYKNGSLRVWQPENRGISNITRSGTTFTATRDDGSTFTFTQQDTNKYHKSGSWSGLTYTATAVNSADELKFTIPNKIQTNWELNATSGNSPALLFTRDSSLTDWKIFVSSGRLIFQSATDGSTWTERAYFKDNSGDFVATSFTGKGSDLTNLNASNISSGTLSMDRIAAGAIANGKLANSKVTIAGNVVNLGESLSDSTLRESLGLSKALRFVGVTTTDMTGGTATNHSWTGTPAGISNYTPKQGDVVINSTKQDEWVCTSVSGTTYTWERLGSDTSYKIVQSAVSDPTASTATSTTFIDTISQNANGVITVTKKTLPTASSTVAGITKVGASGGAAAYSHIHSYLANTNAGAADRPIYITGNAAAQTTYRMAGTNVAATTGITYSGDLDTGIWYVNGISGTDKTTLYNQADGVIIANKYSTSWISEIYQDYRTGQLAIRGKNNGTWAAWRNVLDSTNYIDYAVAKTAGVTAVTWDATNKKLTRTINGTAADVMTAAQMSTALDLGSIATYTAATAGTKDTWGKVPVIGGTDGVMEVGKYIDFHTTDGNTADYDVRITAATTGLTISGTTSGTFSGNLSGNATTATTATNLSAAPTIASGGTATVNLAEDTAYTLTVGGKSVIFKTPADTATAADNILDGSNSGTAITYAPYTAKQDKLSFDTSTTAPDRTDRLNLNGFLYATKYNVAGQVTLQWNATDSSLDFVFA